jgi:hypothetical protein
MLSCGAIGPAKIRGGRAACLFLNRTVFLLKNFSVSTIIECPAKNFILFYFDNHQTCYSAMEWRLRKKNLQFAKTLIVFHESPRNNGDSDNPAQVKINLVCPAF